MAIYHPTPVTCLCGNKFTAYTARSINAGRAPEVKKKIIEGSFHKAECPKCNKELTIDKEFSYSDFKHNLFIKIKPFDQRHKWLNASEALSREVQLIPETLKAKNDLQYRVVFGLSELKEKILAHENKFDDRHIELAKILLMYEHPFLMRKARLRIILDAVNDDELFFIAYYDHDPKTYALEMPRWVVEDMRKNDAQIKEWVKKNQKEDIFDLKDDHWVNIWRWSPQMPALKSLTAFANKVERKEDINIVSKDFENMIRYLPRGSHLSKWAKKDLKILFDYAKKNGHKKLEDSLFEIRFDKSLDDDWAYNDKPGDIDTIWNLLQDLPETNVEGNTALREINLGKGGGGTYDSNVIAMGAKDIGNQEYFEDTIRHEVGHAVHEKNLKKVDDWLKKRFGWQVFDATPKGISEWIRLSGGYGTDDPKEQAEIRRCLLEVLGNGNSWTPSKLSALPATHPWNSKKCIPQVVFKKSQKDKEWFYNYKHWYSFNGKAFFLNYYYQKLCVINASTLELVKGMPSEYAVMSPFEFFAELYALYYNPANPKRKNIPKDVVAWLNKNIGIPK